VLEIIGDTRYDQVLQRCKESKVRQLLPANVLKNKSILVIGSSWKEDEEQLLPACSELMKQHQDVLVVLVPHEPTVDHLERIEQQLNGTSLRIRFSEINDYRGEKFIIVDSVGLLMPLYQYASVAYVGGSFGSGVHNVLEPAVYGIPIIFGPNHENSQEAVRFVTEGAAFVAKDVATLTALLQRFFEKGEFRKQAGEKARSLVTSNAGATEKFLSYLDKVL